MINEIQLNELATRTCLMLTHISLFLPRGGWFVGVGLLQKAWQIDDCLLPVWCGGCLYSLFILPAAPSPKLSGRKRGLSPVDKKSFLDFACDILGFHKRFFEIKRKTVFEIPVLNSSKQRCILSHSSRDVLYIMYTLKWESIKDGYLLHLLVWLLLCGMLHSTCPPLIFTFQDICNFLILLLWWLLFGRERERKKGKWAFN